MSPKEFAKIRRDQLGLTQDELARKLKTTRVTIARYEGGQRRIPGMLEVALAELSRPTALPMAGIVAAGKPIEAVTQNEWIEVPSSMAYGTENFVLKVTGESMRDDGILPGDYVVVRSQSMARSGDTVIALINGEATIKKYYPQADFIELRPVNSEMKPIIVKSNDDFQIQGIVVGVIRYCK
jgi:repressor LexA